MQGKILVFSETNTKIPIHFVKAGLDPLIEAEISFDAGAADGWDRIWDTDFRSVDGIQKTPAIRNGTNNWASRYKTPEIYHVVLKLNIITSIFLLFFVVPQQNKNFIQWHYYDTAERSNGLLGELLWK